MEAKVLHPSESHHPRMHGDERRQQIISASVEVFSQRGFSGATTKEIARAAGVSEATVFKHFANKDELYSAILDAKACEPLMQDPFANLKEFEERSDDFGFFYTAALNILDHHESDRDFLRLMMHSALEGHGLAQLFFDRFAGHAYSYFSTYIARRQAEGRFREIEPRVAVRAFIGTIVHHSLNNILWDKGHKLLEISNEDAARDFANILLDGIRKQQPEQTI